ncbi:glycoside hydrolase family 2 protein [Haloprofundus salilacus]|uniref:glycoside hydrolase family 2 protein n=1 Tax=Haloprofundus salilacus TaxID=2876190 RepID=UPI001CC91949|nr:sugar-binding domain-containing protein [Haloprofundus salilacus]
MTNDITKRARPSTGADESYRTRTDLDGTWEFILDPDDEGETSEWFRNGARWSPEDAATVEVPHSWQEDESLREYTGAAWYRRSVELPEFDPEEYIALTFDAVDYETTVWVNGERVGDHQGGYLPFEFDVSEQATPGTNTVAVRVHDPEDIEEIPHGKQGKPWYTRVSGIWQRVGVEVRPAVHVETIRVTPDLDVDAAHVTVDIANGDEAAIPADLEGTVIVEHDGDMVADARFDVERGVGTATVDLDDPDYWTPDSPTLYDVRVSLETDDEVVDEATDYFGMRSVSHDGTTLLLNGEPFTMRGALDQGYYPDTLYRPFDEDLFEEEIRTAKQLGFNLLRKHIKPAHPDFVELADRLGILVWEEPANPDRYTERSKREVKEQLFGLIERDFNRPSVIAWSLYNEEWGIGGHEDEEPLWTDEEKQEYLAALYEETKERDPTRLACDNSGWAHVATDINDYHRYFVSPDRAEAWADDLDSIESDPSANYGVTETDPESTPAIVSEFGTWGLCDVPKLLEHYDGEPTWFSHEFLDDELKRPEGVQERFAESPLSDVFDDLGNLAEAWQGRESVSVADVIGEMRVRESLAGYVITEFSDIEWEFNGILDYFRDEKSFVDEFASVNAPVYVRVEPESRAVWAGDTVAVDVTLVNDTTVEIDGPVTLDAFDETVDVPVSLDGYGVARAETVELDVPEEASGPVDVAATLGDADSADKTSASTTETLTVVSRDAVRADADAQIYSAEDRLTQSFDALGFETVANLSDADIAVASGSVSDDLAAFAESGGSVVVVPDVDGHLQDDAVFEYRTLPETESWNLVASLLYHDGSLLGDLVDGERLDWAFEGLYPYEIATDVDDDDRLDVGYVEGWLANEGAALLRRPHGNGVVAGCCFRVGDADQPVGAYLLSTLVETVGVE